MTHLSERPTHWTPDKTDEEWRVLDAIIAEKKIKKAAKKEAKNKILTSQKEYIHTTKHGNIYKNVTKLKTVHKGFYYLTKSGEEKYCELESEEFLGTRIINAVLHSKN